MNIGYKVVTRDMKSLGLRKNPNILTFPFQKWLYLPANQIKKGKQDFGGIWVTKNLSGAKKLQRYMLDKYNQKTRIFKSKLDKILYSNSPHSLGKSLYILPSNDSFAEDERSLLDEYPRRDRWWQDPAQLHNQACSDLVPRFRLLQGIGRIKSKIGKWTAGDTAAALVLKIGN